MITDAAIVKISKQSIISVSCSHYICIFMSPHMSHSFILPRCVFSKIPSALVIIFGPLFANICSTSNNLVFRLLDSCAMIHRIQKD